MQVDTGRVYETLHGTSFSQGDVGMDRRYPAAEGIKHGQFLQRSDTMEDGRIGDGLYQPLNMINEREERQGRTDIRVQTCSSQNKRSSGVCSKIYIRTAEVIRVVHRFVEVHPDARRERFLRIDAFAGSIDISCECERERSIGCGRRVDER